MSSVGPSRVCNCHGRFIRSTATHASAVVNIRHELRLITSAEVRLLQPNKFRDLIAERLETSDRADNTVFLQTSHHHRQVLRSASSPKHGVMFNPPRRPRAPSVAALRVLYQLAYISSGTVLAGGLLCLEEQRRRIQIVQKIADNAKRLRSHPRYNHHAPRRIAPGSLDADFSYLIGDEEITQNDRSGRPTSADLPSVVSRGYGHLRTGKDPRRKGVVKDRREDWSHDDDASDFWPSLVDAHQELRHRHKLEDRLHRQDDTSRLTPWPSIVIEEDALPIADHVYYRTEPYWSTYDTSTVPSAYQLRIWLSDDLSSFIATAIRARHRQNADDRGDMVTTATHLASLAIAIDDLSTVASLCVWHAATEGVREELVDVLISSSGIAGGVTRSSCPKLDSRLLSWLGETSTLDYRGLAALCSTLMNTGLTELATEIMLAIPYARWQAGEADIALASIFTQALSESHLGRCDRLLRWAGGSLKHPALANDQIRVYIDKCAQTRAFTFLTALFVNEQYDTQTNISWLTDKDLPSTTNRRNLAYTFSRKLPRTSRLAQAAMLHLDNRSLTQLQQSLSRSHAVELWQAWRLNRNYGDAVDHYKRLLRAPNQHLPGVDMQHHLHLTMATICLVRKDWALFHELLQELKSSKQDTNTFVLKLLAHAQTQEWQLVQEMLQVRMVGTMSSLSGNLLNMALLRFRDQHDNAEDFVKFSIALFDALGIHPYIKSHQIVMQAAVLGEKAGALRTWFETCSQRGWPLDLSAQLITDLLEQHVGKFRTDTSKLMQTAHRLSTEVPELAGESLRGVLFSLIARDWKEDRRRRTDGVSKQQWDLLVAQQPAFPKPDLDEHGVTDARSPIEQTCIASKSSAAQHDRPPFSDAAPQDVEVMLPPMFAMKDHGPLDIDRQLSASEHTVELSGVARKHAKQPVLDIDNTEPEDMAFEDEDSREAALDLDTLVKERDLKWRRMRPKMILAMQQRRYNQVVSLYRQSCDDRQCPPTILALNLVVRACVNNDGDYKTAESILAAAEAVGMRVLLQSRHILKHEIDNSPDKALNALSKRVLDWYERCAELNEPATSALALAIAYRFVKRGTARRALHFLQSVPQTRWQALDTLDPSLAAEYIRAYVRTHQSVPLYHLIERIVQTNCPVTRKMLETTRQAMLMPHTVSQAGNYYGTAKEHEYNRMAFSHLRALHKRQQRKTESFLWNFVSVLADYHNRSSAKDTASPQVDSVLGDDVDDLATVHTSI